MHYLAPLLAGTDLPTWADQRWVILGWMMWIPMTYIAVGLARLFPLNTSRWPLYVPLHVVGAVACSSIGGALRISSILAESTPCRSTIVNLDRVEALEPTDPGDVVARLTTGKRLRVGRSRRKELEKRLGL